MRSQAQPITNAFARKLPEILTKFSELSKSIHMRIECKDQYYALLHFYVMETFF